MSTNLICNIIHAAVTNFDIVMIEDLVIFMISTKCLSNNCKNCLAKLVLTFLLNGGLYQMMFLPQFLLSCVYCFFTNMSFSEYPHLLKLSLKNGVAAMKTCSS